MTASHTDLRKECLMNFADKEVLVAGKKWFSVRIYSGRYRWLPPVNANWEASEA